MTVSLIKTITPLSTRGIGQRKLGIDPRKMVAAGHSYNSIANQLGGEAYKIGRMSPRKAFCVKALGAYYIFAHREFRRYGNLFRTFYGPTTFGRDVDHVMAKSIAEKCLIPYVLLAAVASSVNRSHGFAEKLTVGHARGIFLDKTYPLDERMFHKVLGRRLYARQTRVHVLRGYSLGDFHNFDITLKQKGIWNEAFHIGGNIPGSGKLSLLP